MYFSIPALAAALVATASATDISTGGPFRLFTTLSTSFPITPTRALSLYYPYYVKDLSPGLNLASYSELRGTEFMITAGVLGTTQRPDDVGGSLPWNATTPGSKGLVVFQNQYSPHAGFDILDGFLAIHGVVDNTWYLCPSNDGFHASLLYYAASSVPGCTATRVAVLNE